MRFLLSSDLHIPSGPLPTYDLSYEELINEGFAWLEEQLSHVDAWIIAGDIFHNNQTVPYYTMIKFMELCYSTIGLHGMFFVCGQHDVKRANISQGYEHLGAIGALLSSDCCSHLYDHKIHVDGISIVGRNYEDPPTEKIPEDVNVYVTHESIAFNEKLHNLGLCKHTPEDLIELNPHVDLFVVGDIHERQFIRTTDNSYYVNTGPFYKHSIRDIEDAMDVCAVKWDSSTKEAAPIYGEPIRPTTKYRDAQKAMNTVIAQLKETSIEPTTLISELISTLENVNIMKEVFDAIHDTLPEPIREHVRRRFSEEVESITYRARNDQSQA